MLSFDFVLNEPCLFDCYYCHIKNGSNETTIDIVNKHMYIFDFINWVHKKNIEFNVVFQGGDISLMNKDIIHYIIKKIPIKPILSVQSTFIPYIDEFYDEVELFFLHLSDLNAVKRVNYPVDPKIKTGIVDKDIQKIKYFLELNPNVDYISYESPLDKFTTSDDVINFHNEIQKLKQNEHSTHIIETLQNNDINELRKNCRKSSYYVINLANETLMQCIRSKNTRELNRNNFMDYIINKPEIDNVCKFCSRSFLDKPQVKTLDKIKIMKEFK